jgi:hypothetical protein
MSRFFGCINIKSIERRLVLKPAQVLVTDVGG